MRFTMFALRNLVRSRRRSLTVLAMTALGSVALVLSGGYVAASFRSLRENTIASGLGHLQIGIPGFREDEDRPLSRGLSEVDAIRATALHDPRVQAVMARIECLGLVSNGEKSVPFLGRAVEPEVEYGRAGFPTQITAGRAVRSTGADEAVLGTGLARALKVTVGGSLTVLSTTVDGALNGFDVTVVGLMSSGVREMDDRLLVLPLGVAQRLLGTGKVSKLVVRLHDTADTEAVGDALGRAFAHDGRRLEIVSWSELATFYHQVRALYAGIFIFLGLIILTLVVVSSGNVIAMTVVERTREIGTLMALGTGRLRILWMCIAEGVGLGVIGGGAGVGLGVALARALTGAGIMMPPPPTFTTGFRLVIDVVPELGIGVFVSMVTTLLVASIPPAARAASLRITEALGHI